MRIRLIILLFTSLCHLAQAESLTQEQWRYDIETLNQVLTKNHPNLYHSTSSTKLKQAFTIASEETNDQFRYIALSKALATVGDGHTSAPLLPLPIDMGVSFNYLPIQFKKFSDGYFVISASRKYQALIGSKVIEIADIPVLKVENMISPYISTDNEFWKQDLSQYYLTNVSLLNFVLGKSSSQDITVTVKNGNKLVTHTVDKLDYLDTINWIDGYFVNDDKGNDWINTEIDSPLFGCKQNYCKTLIKPENIMVMTIRNMQDQDNTFRTFVEESFEEIDKNKIDKLIIDLRLNRGGNGSVRWPLIYKLVNHRINTQSNLAVLISPKVFSAAMMLAVDLEKHTNAVFIGKNTGSSPNHYGETRFFQLPNSRFSIIYSGLYWQNGHPNDSRTSITPDIPITEKSEAFFSKTDQTFESAKFYLLQPRAANFDRNKSLIGKALIYTKSNIDGSNFGNIAVYHHDFFEVESFKWHDKQNHGTVVKAEFNPETLIVKNFKAYQMDSAGKNTQTATLRTDRFVIETQIGDSRQTFHTHGKAWHSYDFDFTSLGYIFPYLRNKHFYQFEVNDLDLSVSPPPFKNFGPASLSQRKATKYLNKKAWRYLINGEGLDMRGGYIWFDKKTGVLLGFEIQKPDEPGYQSGKLTLQSIKELSPEQWRTFQLNALNQH